MFESLRTFAFTRSANLTTDGRSISRMLRDEPFAALIAERMLGNGRRPGPASDHARPTHAAAAVTSYPAAFGFLHARFAGRPMRANTSRYLHDLAEETELPPEDLPPEDLGEQ
jgi:hypothetical protein